MELTIALPPRESPEEREDLVEETRVLFGDEVAEHLAKRIRAQQHEESEPPKV